MGRILKISRYALPLLLAGAGAALKISAGQLGLPLALVVAGGALLGWTVSLVLESVALLSGLVVEPPAVSLRRLQELEREKEMVLRSIKDLELDASLQKVEAEEARALSQPLRDRAIGLLQELDRVRADQARTIDEQIEQELRQRTERAGETE